MGLRKEGLHKGAGASGLHTGEALHEEGLRKGAGAPGLCTGEGLHKEGLRKGAQGLGGLPKGLGDFIMALDFTNAWGTS